MKHNTSLWQLSYPILYPCVVMGAQAEVSHYYILVKKMHSFQHWKKGCAKRNTKGFYPHQAETAPKTVQVRVEMVPDKKMCEQKSFLIIFCTTHQFKFCKSKANFTSFYTNLK